MLVRQRGRSCMQRFARLTSVLVFAGFAVIAIALAGTTTGVAADSHRSQFKTVLIGYEETPGTINTDDFASLVKAIRSGVTYANVHSPKFPSGEIRGQIDGRLGQARNDSD